jgi:hypothetical protein
MADVNGQVGRDTTGYQEVIGRYGEQDRNNNGKRLLQFCLANNLVVLNTMYPHMDIHKYTRVQPVKDERSIIDYIMIRKTERPTVRDVRVNRGTETGSDHLLLVINKVMAAPTSMV